MEEALSLVAQGIVPFGGGTRLFRGSADLPNLLDLSGLGLGEIRLEDGDLVVGAMVRLQELVDSPLTDPATAGLLSEACRLQAPSRALRNMATMGGEAVTSAHDSEVVTALLALNAIFVVAGPEGRVEVPALRFLKNPVADLGAGLLEAVVIPGPPGGAALERASILPSAPPIVAVCASVTFGAEKCVRARIAIAGLNTSPGRILEAESRIEGTTCEAADVERCVEQIASRGTFREDGRGSSAYRQHVTQHLVGRALERAVDRARSQSAPVPHRTTPSPKARLATAPSYFTSGRIDLTVNGESLHLEAEARTSLLSLLRAQGLWGTKRGCESGDCGACTVLLDGRPVLACILPAIRAFGRTVVTVEGLGRKGSPHKVQGAFLREGVNPCGFCTPAMELCARALLDAVTDPTEEEARDALSGCACPCAGHSGAVAALLRAAGR
jgi:carbon-monoxide dehydrogenase small subunit